MAGQASVLLSKLKFVVKTAGKHRLEGFDEFQKAFLQGPTKSSISDSKDRHSKTVDTMHKLASNLRLVATSKSKFIK